jgi:hypothetical protein
VHIPDHRLVGLGARTTPEDLEQEVVSSGRCAWGVFEEQSVSLSNL